MDFINIHPQFFDSTGNLADRHAYRQTDGRTDGQNRANLITGSVVDGNELQTVTLSSPSSLQAAYVTTAQRVMSRAATLIGLVLGGLR